MAGRPATMTTAANVDTTTLALIVRFMAGFLVDSRPRPLNHEPADVAWLRAGAPEGLGRPAPYVEGQIATIAHASDLVVVTLNTRVFSSFTDLTIEN